MTMTEVDSGISEWETRRRYIDKLLLECEWQQILDYSEGRGYDTAAVREYPTDNGPADYALFHNGELLAFVEAKKVGRGVIAALDQAERYSRGHHGETVYGDEFGVPFGYSSNGVYHAFLDLRKPTNLRREVARFHTPKALRELLSSRSESACSKLNSTSNLHSTLRPYQMDAIKAVEERVCDGKREMLLAMATGTGKTFTIVSLIYRLMWSGMAKRVLFLVDRRSLAAQAVTALNAFEAEPNKKFAEIYEVYSNRFRKGEFEDDDVKFDPKVLPEKYLTDPDPGHSFVYVCTIQRMRNNLFGPPQGAFGSGDVDEEEEGATLDIPIHAFDLIIADECHRGYTSSEDSKWREVLEHFDAIKVGLTATPALHTTTFFKELAYRYSYKEAVDDNFLVDYDCVRIHSEISMEGMTLAAGQEVKMIDTGTGEKWYDRLEDERHIDVAKIEREATSPDRNRKIIQEFKKYALAQEKELGRFPKTLVFAVSDLEHTSHADTLVNIINEEFNRGHGFCRKITGKSDRPLEYIRRFRNRPEPAVVVTVDMLSTGVDIPRLENIILLRPIKSRILFEQMLGRGTRLCKDLSPTKDHFTVFDVFGVVEAFKGTVDIVADPPDKPSMNVSEVVKNIADNRDRDYNIRILSRRLLRAHKSVSQDGRERFQEIIGTQDLAEFARQLKDRIDNDWSNIMPILHSHEFIDHMENYPSNRVFLEGMEVTDTVSSEILFKAKDGTLLKPEDYIQQFEKFIKENPEQIEALEILLKRPKEFHTEELADLRYKLEQRPEKFSENRLRKAYNQELADIISMVKHAARGVDIEDPKERAQRAMKFFMMGKAFTPEQEKWLAMIEESLETRIILDRDDFRTTPFSRYGGEHKANEVFEGKLQEILDEINEAVLA
jgi:type I restriction enzyme R subunit